MKNNIFAEIASDDNLTTDQKVTAIVEALTEPVKEFFNAHAASPEQKKAMQKINERNAEFNAFGNAVRGEKAKLAARISSATP
jgi:hypothetical protein